MNLQRKKEDAPSGGSRTVQKFYSQNFYIYSFLKNSVETFGGFGDEFAPHRLVELVSEEQLDQYIDALDVAFLNELVTSARGEGVGPIH